MRGVTRWGVVVGSVLLAGDLAMGQNPAPAVPGAAPAGVAGAVAPAAPKMGIFARGCAALAACKQKLCASPAGQMLNNASQPLATFTGGVIPPFCPGVPSPADLAKPGVSGTADAIKKDALEAKARREKVRYLGTVDCRYYPDATVALVAALRTDASECVRYEAAVALSRGCCCNRLTIAALEACVSGLDKDGNPPERSDRVRYTAAIGLERCLTCYTPPPVEPEPATPPKVEQKELSPKELAPAPSDAPPGKLPPATPDVTPAAHKKVIPEELRAPPPKMVEEARRTLDQFKALLATGPRVAAPTGADRTSMVALVRNSVGANPPVEVPVGRTVVSDSGGMPVTAPAVPVNPLSPIVVQVMSGATPAERQAAVQQLSRYDWRDNLLVATGLIAAAKSDPSPAVRTECVRQIAARQVIHPQVLADLTVIAANDADPAVRDEAAKALGQLKSKP